MSATHLAFDKKPNNAIAMTKALLLPRAGFNTAVGLPELEASWRGATVDAQALAGYCNTLGIAPSPYLPIAYPHVMAGTLCMNMLAHQRFPIRLLGALHVKNRIIQQRPISTSERLDIHMTLGGFRLIEKGMEFDFFTEVTAASEGGDKTAKGPQLWRETSTYFVRGKFGIDDTTTSEKSFELESLEEAEPLQQWQIPKDRGRAYASISGDYNPIHMSRLAAKVFGFKRDIAHGFGVMAQAIDRANALPDPATLLSTGQAVQLDVIFKGPIFLESEVSLKQKPKQAPGRLDLYCGNNPRPNLCIAVSALAH